MSFWDIFRTRNRYNEKNIVGFLSFAVMSLFATVDIVTGILGKELVHSDTIFNSFVIVTLGAFGIAEAGQIFGKKEKEED
jgi:hypothetical protein|tara:strand:+ start:4382 stop:4621 length:240 start_codon:yes stop_codon:yes gene_type:complete